MTDLTTAATQALNNIRVTYLCRTYTTWGCDFEHDGHAVALTYETGRTGFLHFDVYDEGHRTDVLRVLRSVMREWCAQRFPGVDWDN